MLRALIIGYGSIGKRHAEVLVEAGLEVELVTSQSSGHFKAYRAIGEVPDIGSYDYYIISNKTSEHYDTLIELESVISGKQVLVEKPLFHKEIPVSGFNNQIFIAYNLRFNPIIQKLKDLLRDERVLFIQITAGQYLPDWRPGRDYKEGYSASRSQGGGVLLDLSHEIDYLQWICGDITKVTSVNRKISSLEIESDDICTAIGETAEGIIFNFSIDYLSKFPVRKILVHSEEKSFLADIIGNTLKIGHKGREPEIINYDKYERNYTYTMMHREILDSIGGKPTTRVATIEEGLAVMKAITEIRENSH